jgi:hypothetical protein
MAPPNVAVAETLPSARDTIPSPPPRVFDEAPPWAKALFLACEELRAAVTNTGEELSALRGSITRLSYRMGALSLAMTVQEHRTIQLEELAVKEPPLASVIPMRGV